MLISYTSDIFISCAENILFLGHITPAHGAGDAAYCYRCHTYTRVILAKTGEQIEMSFGRRMTGQTLSRAVQADIDTI